MLICKCVYAVYARKSATDLIHFSLCHICFSLKHIELNKSEHSVNLNDAQKKFVWNISLTVDFDYKILWYVYTDVIIN